jgi:hypothetical protein
MIEWCHSLENGILWPERVNDGSCGHKRDFALLHPLDHGGEVSPILGALLKVIENTSFAFVDFGQDETHVAGRGRVEIHRVRELWPLGHVIAQKSFLSGTVVRRLHPRPVALQEAVALRYLIGRGNNGEGNLNFVVIVHSWFSEFKSKRFHVEESSVNYTQTASSFFDGDGNGERIRGVIGLIQKLLALQRSTHHIN